MSCVVSIYCTIHRVNRNSFSRQKGQTVLVNMPLVFTHRQIASFFFFYKLFTAQYKTAIQHVFEAVTRCKMHCQKNPWKIPHWGNIFKIIHFFFRFVFLRCHPSSAPLLLIRVFLSRAHSYQDVATSLRTQKRPFLWSGKFTNREKRRNFSFIVTKTEKKTKQKQKKTRKQLEINHVVFK